MPRRTPAARRRKGSAASRTPPRRPTAAPATRRADFGAPIDAFFERQPPPLRGLLVALRALIEAAAPDATSSIKWGMPHYEIDGARWCALGAHRAHVNLILAGPPEGFEDPGKLLAGVGTTGRHLKLSSLDQLPRAAVRGWLRTSAEAARAGRSPPGPAHRRP